MEIDYVMREVLSLSFPSLGRLRLQNLVGEIVIGTTVRRNLMVIPLISVSRNFRIWEILSVRNYVVRVTRIHRGVAVSVSLGAYLNPLVSGVYVEVPVEERKRIEITALIPI